LVHAQLWPTQHERATTIHDTALNLVGNGAADQVVDASSAEQRIALPTALEQERTWAYTYLQQAWLRLRIFDPKAASAIAQYSHD
jgi:hypothetical protein